MSAFSDSFEGFFDQNTAMARMRRLGATMRSSHGLHAVIEARRTDGKPVLLMLSRKVTPKQQRELYFAAYQKHRRATRRLDSIRGPKSQGSSTEKS